MILAYIVSPDLSSVTETWLTKLIGNAWIGESLQTLLIIAFSFGWFYYSLFIYKTVYTKKTKFTEYFSFLSYERYDKFWTGVLPKHVNHIVAACGFAAPFALIASRMLTTVEWTLCAIDTDLYVDFWRLTEKDMFMKPEDLVSIIVCLLMVAYWYRAEHKKSNAAASESGEE